MKPKNECQTERDAGKERQKETEMNQGRDTLSRSPTALEGNG